MQVGQLADHLLFAPPAADQAKRNRRRNQQHHCAGQNREPEPAQAVQSGWLARSNAFLNAGAEGRARGEPVASSVYGTLLLNPAQALRSTGRTSSQMLAQRPRIADRKLTV